MKYFTIMFISNIVFDVLFWLLNKFNSNIFFMFKKIPHKWKGNLLIKWLVISLLVSINIIVMLYFQLGDFVRYVIMGFILSLSNFALNKTQETSN